MKSINYKEIELKSQELWKLKPIDDPKYTILMPPPNLTGSLHIGHFLTSSIQDFIVRFETIINNNPGCILPGFDHGGISAEYSAIKNLNLDKKDPDFLNKVNDFVNSCRTSIESQINEFAFQKNDKFLGYTMDEKHYALVQQAFIRFYNDGLIYRKQTIANYDIIQKTAVSDLEIEHKEEKGKMYKIPYRVKDSEEILYVESTRPETIFADIALAFYPNDERYKTYLGKTAFVPIINREIPILESLHVSQTQGTGLLKITPAHSPVDWEIYEDFCESDLTKYQIKPINIITKNNTFTNEELDGHFEEFNNWPIDKLKEYIIHYLNLESTDIIHNVPYAKGKIEYLLQSQWFFNIKSGAQKAIDVLNKSENQEEEELNIYPEYWKNTYTSWLNNIKPWCISRTISWGQKIPVFYNKQDPSKYFVSLRPPICNECKPGKKSFFCWSCSEILLYVFAFIFQFLLNKFLFQSTSWSFLWSALIIAPFVFLYQFLCFKKQSKVIEEWQKSDEVFDTWFSSALWPEYYKAYHDKFPTNTLVTAYDILFFWVARMVMVSLLINGKVPFKNVFIHGLVRDSQGKKMSKTAGNVVDPIELINQYGQDNVRMSLLLNVKPNSNIRFGEDYIQKAKSISTKLWNLGFYVKNFCLNNHKKTESNIKWIIDYFDNYMDENVKKIKYYMKTYDIHLVIDLMIQSIYEICDWLIELHKLLPDLSDFVIKIFKKLLMIVYSLCPFLTTYLWHDIFNDFIGNYIYEYEKNIEYEINEFNEFKNNIRYLRFLNKNGFNIIINEKTKYYQILERLSHRSSKIQTNNGFYKLIEYNNMELTMVSEIHEHKLNIKISKINENLKKINEKKSTFNKLTPKNIIQETEEEIQKINEELNWIKTILN